MIQVQFDCTSLEHRKIKGTAQPSSNSSWSGEPARPAAPIAAAGPAGLTPLTGRDREIDLIKDRWEQAQEGMGQVVLLVGEPGLGKSRVVYTLKEHVLGQSVEGEVDAPVIEWRCSPHYQNTGLYPAVDFYERALAFGREEPPSARFDRLLRRLESYELDRPETVPLWAALLSLPSTDRFPTPSLPPARLREETFRAMLEWLHTRAARKPILFVVEDLHWADASTLEFLGQFLAENQHDSVLTLLTFRPEFTPPWPAVAHQTSLALNRLSRRQVGDLMRKTTGAALPESMVDQVYDRAGGVPLFVEEFTKMMRESVGSDEAGQDDAGSGTLPRREIPATLQDLVMARLDRLGGERDVAQLASALGREFGHDLLAAIATQDEATLQAELAKLMRAEILYPKGRPPRCTYIFKHALLEDALYGALVKDTRQQFHRRIGEVLEARFPETLATQPELVAHHFTEAGLIEKAIGYWLKAGLRSRGRSAEKEAIGHLTRGLALLGALAESRGRDARELELSVALGAAYIASRGYAAPEIGPVFLRARELCERIGRSPQLVAIVVGIWEWHFVRGEIGLCRELVAEAMEFARPLDDPGGMMEASYTAGQTMLYRADFAGARDSFATAVADFDDPVRVKFWAAQTGHYAGINIRCNLAVSLWHLGYPDQALRVNREVCQMARGVGHPFSLAYCLHHTSWLYHFCRLGIELQVTSEEQVAISSEQGFALWHATGTFFRGAGMLLQGQPQESLPLLRKGYDDFRATGAEILRPFQLSALGEAYTRTARFEEAHAAFDEGLALAERNDDCIQEAELHRLKGELLLVQSPAQEAAAEDCFTRAIETARRQQSRAWELRSTMSLARLWQRQGRRDEARRNMAAVHGTYTEGWMTSDLMEAGALLEALAWTSLALAIQHASPLKEEKADRHASPLKEEKADRHASPLKEEKADRRFFSRLWRSLRTMKIGTIQALGCMGLGTVLGFIAATGDTSPSSRADGATSPARQAGGNQASEKVPMLFGWRRQERPAGAGRSGHGQGAAGPGREEAEHRLHHGRRHRLVQHRRLSPGDDGREDAEPRPARLPGDALHRLLRRGELHGRPRGVHHRRAADPHRPDDGRSSGGQGRTARRGLHDRHGA